MIYHLDGEVKSWAELQRPGGGGFFAEAFQRELFQTLVHIALASLWVMPVIAAGMRSAWSSWCVARSFTSGSRAGFISTRPGTGR